jgi:transmembrane sensor
MSEEIFSRILNDLATETEKRDFYNSLDKDTSLRGVYYQYKNLYALLNNNSPKNVQLQQDSFQRFWSRAKPAKVRSIVKFWYQYAAVFVIALLIGSLLQHFIVGDKGNKEVKAFTQHIVYTSEKGSVSTIYLEDGSSIWLSSASKITLNKSSNGEMSAQLNGEAYFDMVPNPDRKFVVDLGYFKVKDIGTKFNVRAYDFENTVYTALVEGKVDFFQNGDKSILSMIPGDYVRYDKKTNHMAVSQQDPNIATSWKDGKFVFINKTLSEICLELENWYNVDISIKNKSLANTKYTSVIKRTTTVKMVLKMLALTDKINYKIDERKEVRDIVYIY